MRIRDPESRMETIRIRDPGWKKVRSGTGINIPDPQHWLYQYRVWTACTVLFVSETREKMHGCKIMQKYSKQT
jgi:hypothetical protein